MASSISGAALTDISLGNVGIYNITEFMLLVVLTVFFINIIGTILSRSLKKRIGAPYYKLLPKFVTYPLYFGSIYYGFSTILGLNVGAFLAAFGILGIGVALSAQQTLQNMVAGTIITIERPFQIGDIIDYAGNVCRVKDIFLRNTLLRAADGKIIYAPNSAFVSGNVINYTKGEVVRVQTTMYFPIATDVKRVEEIIFKACHDHTDILPHLHKKKESFIDRLLDEPINVANYEPRVFLKSIDKDRLIIEAWFWIEDIRQREVILSSLLEISMKRFQEEGIRYG